MRKFLHSSSLVFAASIFAAGVAFALVSIERGGSDSVAGRATSSSLAPPSPSFLQVGDPLRRFPRPLPIARDHALGAIAWSAAGPYIDGHVLVGFRGDTPRAVEHALERRAGAIRVRPLGLGVLLTVRRGAVPSTITRLKRDLAVSYAEPDYVMHANGLPNDPQFGLQWGLQNTGQIVNGSGGTANADEHVVPAWNVTTGSSSVVVAVTDTGVEYTHPDLAANIWTNPGGLGGCAAGTHGFDVLAGENPCDPMDTDVAYGGHGTHVAGIIGAVGNNGTGVAGVNWTTTILPVKWLDSNSSGATSDLINALQMVIAAKQAGVNVRVVNDSPTFVGTAYSQALSNELDQLGANDILFVTPAGNTAQDNDTTPRYPCAYDRPNELCVAATDQNDQAPSWANWGPNTVDMSAPGNNIYSTLRGASYGYISGSSMSAAEVSGAAALILSVGYQSVTALKADILNNLDPDPFLQGLTRTGGRLDVCRAVPGCSLPATATTFGKTTIGAYSDTAGANRKRVNRYAVTGNVSVTKLSMYLQPTSTSGSQQLEGLIYADASGAPGSLVAVSNPITFSSTEAAGWYDLTFPTAVNLTAGTYWIGFMSGSTGGVAGFRYDMVSGNRDLNTNTYTSGPSNPFGTPSSDSEQMSIYATYSNPIPAPAMSAPADFTPPALSGSAQIGRSVSTSNGVWTGSPTGYTYQWLRCNPSGNSCAAISGATSQSYTVAGADGGSVLKAAVTAANPAGSALVTSAATTTITASAPSNTTAPAISGSAQAGQLLTVNNGSWAGSPTSYAYHWQRCNAAGNNCAAISGAISQTYTVASGDVGSTLEATVTASNPTGSASSSSSPTATVLPLAPTNSGAPLISGSAQVGQTLSTSNGTWTGSPIGFAYQWQRCDANGNNCAAISGATSQTYAVGNADVGSTLEAVVTASNPGGSTAASSAPTASVPAVAPANTTPPAISGTPQVGQTLTTSNGVWSGTPATYGYQWLRCDLTGNNCASISGATSQTYTAGVADLGSTLEATVTASNTAGSASATAMPTSSVTEVPPANTAPPAISDAPQSGQTFSTSNGSWTGSPTGYAYQWNRCNTSGNSCTAIAGATSPTYVATDADIGSTVDVIVTATNAAGSTSASSASTATVVAPPPANTTLPVIAGTAQVGQTLSTGTGAWSGSPTGYTYQWNRCDRSGNNCTAILGATAQAYAVASADVGSTLVASVTASNSTGAATASSAATATVPQVPPSNTSPPTVSGTAMSGQTLTASAGTWGGTAPTYGYQWDRCSGSCAAISGATSQTYQATANDVGNALEVVVTASNTAGSATATSAATTTVQAAATATLGQTAVGSNSDLAGANRERVNKYTLSGPGTVTKLTMYLQPTWATGSQSLQGVIYADASGAPGSLIAVSNPITYSSTETAGWYDLTFASPVHIAAGNYWLGFMSGTTYGVTGFRWTSVSHSRYMNSDTFTSGAANPFGSGTNDSEEMSLYATYTPG